MKIESIIQADHLNYTYDGEDAPALNGLSLNIKQGKKTAVMGANGSGKSTFFLCLNGILRPQKGTLSFRGTPYSYDKKSLLNLRSKVGIVFQDPDNQLFSANVRQEISFGILNLGVDSETALKETEKIMDALDITEFQDRPTHALSGGQKKQVAIADILVMHPDIVILDEPSAALDSRHTALVNKTINQMTKAGITVLLSTHDSDYAFAWADEVILFHQGKVLKSGSPAEVFADRPALEAANLSRPAVLTIFESLYRKGIIKADTPVPRNLSELEHIIDGIR
ncbi:energy-coupling factor ABC transporter ATP-binding protein [Anaerostipes sp.]|uniref:energy-coupling factor ABC transporter ATP-binding protein n=1 Tax=Anaerostipes sp. TaxID=1872530 RepID=UPI0025C2EE0E|nr:ABC transporter ATP-binding protein [Anaerostipes sp.]MBS7007362.1 ABC transporter ATP-binding protein [Anaerostipes sp.]